MAGAASLALPAPLSAAAPADPPERSRPSRQSVGSLLSRLQSLYRKAEEATEAYNATEEKLKVQQKRVDELNDELATARVALTGSREAAGRIAREQYQGTSGTLARYVSVFLSSDPQQALDSGHRIQRAAGQRAATVDRLAKGEKYASGLAARARAALDEQQVLAARQKRQRDAVRKRLGEVEKMLASLTGRQLADIQRLEQKNVGEAQRKLLSSGRLSGSTRPSAAGGRAIAYAYRQFGKPYVWGAAGPDAFDCSGLTSQAWAHAGDTIPRTSQEQWRTLPRVSLDELRPGDLVVYFEGATHVALYIGNGLVMQSPRPGGSVKVSPIAANPLLGAVRPDAGEEPLRRYVPPRMPEGALAGPDTGYGSAQAPSGA
ncbi:NlpC/P60 family protein [Streptomyces sp. URMC 124]|uniref:C40 family peptidase n=1 Tax=Streptomyces sp. URMC 124 TaxID=3423405 RepID=UPI003F1CB140